MSRTRRTTVVAVDQLAPKVPTAERRHRRAGRSSRRLIRSAALAAVVALVTPVAVAGSVLAGTAAPPAFAACGSGCGPYPVTGSKPSSIAAGPGGAMWFTEEANDKIGRISAGGQVKTFAVPTAQAWPNSITAGPDGNLWFVEPGAPSTHPTYPDKIGRITPEGVITEFPIDAISAAPNAITAGSDGNLWFTEGYSGGATYIDSMTTGGSLLASYSVTGASDITAGPDGALWFTDPDGDIGRITTSGEVNYFPVPDSLAPISIAPGADGALWFTTYSNEIGRITTGGTVTLYTVPTDGQNTGTWGISPGPDGNVWVTLYGTDELARVNTQPGMTGQITVYSVPVSGEAAGPYGIAAGTNGDVWFTDYLAGEVVDYPVSPVVSQYPVSTSNIYGTASGPKSDEWFTDGNQVDRVCQNGTLQTYNTPTAEGGAYGITEGPYPHGFNQQVVGIWFTEASADRIGVIPESAGSAVGQPCGSLTPTDFPIPTTRADPLDIVSGPDGNLWFTESAADQIGRITDTGTVTEFPLPTAGAEPFDIVSGPDGNLWFTEYGANQIGRITTSGVVTEFPIPTVGSAPTGITAGPDGNLWFTESNANQIGRITTSGVVTEFPIPTAESYPGQIAAGPDGNLWFTEDHAAQVARITPSGTVTEFGLWEAKDPVAISATYGGLAFGDSNGGESGIATLDPPGANAVVLPTGPAPATDSSPFGSSLTWTDLSPVAQTISDGTGMDLYTTASGGTDSGSIFSYRFTAAGTYPYVAAPVGSTTTNGTVKVPIQVSSTQTTINSSVTVTWATTAAPFGYTYDVQVMKPGGSYKSWIKGTSAASSAFSVGDTPGDYLFRARLRDTSNGAFSGWSPAAEFLVAQP